MQDKIYFHLDANSAFLSWSAAYRTLILGESLDLRTIPSVVGGNQEKCHGIVLAKSVPAKKYGIQTGEPLISAQKKCPNLVIIPPDYHLYATTSKAFMEKLMQYSNNIIQYSIDEAWMEFTGCEHLWGSPVAFAHQLKEEIKQELGFTVNVGISTNKLLSKMAGGFKKPDRVHTLFPEEIPYKMWPLPVTELFWVGKATYTKLKKLGITTIGELAHADINIIRANLKKPGEIIYNYANGGELEEYVAERPNVKGYGNSMTAPWDITNYTFAEHILLSLCETTAARIRADNFRVSCVDIHLVYTNFEYIGTQCQLSSPTDVTEEIYRAAKTLLYRLWDGVNPVRQIGVHTSKVTVDSGRQYNVFDMYRYDRLERWDKTIDKIRARFGEDSVFRASYLKAPISHMSGGLDKERRTSVTVGIDLNKEQYIEV